LARAVFVVLSLGDFGSQNRDNPGNATMAKSIVASISEMLTPEIIGKFATASGLDRTTTGAALGAAVPTILSSLADLAATPVGARKLASSVAQQTSDLESLANHLADSSQSADHGNDLLSSMLGKRSTNVIAAGIANLLGISANSIQTLVGMVTPFILGGLRRVQSAQGLDANGLTRMLVDQKDIIAQAIPSDLSSYVRRSTTADETSPHNPPARPGSQRHALGATSAARSRSDDARGASWPYWALALVALGGLLWAILPGGEEEETAFVPTQTVEPSKLVSATPASATYILRPDHNWRSIGTASNAYVNRTIYSARGEELGTVQDLMVGADGKAAAAVISVGRYLGIGDKVVAVPFTALRTEQSNGNSRLVVDLVKEALQTAPQYESSPAAKP
jgi:hypothetical protein